MTSLCFTQISLGLNATQAAQTTALQLHAALGAQETHLG